MANTNNKLYNYLVNTFGISKKMVEEYIDKRLEDLITNHFKQKLSNSRFYEELILNRITHILTEGFPPQNGYWHSRDMFDTYLQKEIKKVIESHIEKNFNILIERKSNENK